MLLHSKKIKIALAGNPNCGKSSLFNSLTGLNQKVGNYPGVTVDKKTGIFNPPENSGKGTIYEIIDLPGAYSLHTRSEDEKISTGILTHAANPDYPDVVIYIADASNLKRSLLYCTQIMDAGQSVILALNMIDIAEKNGIQINCAKLSALLNVPILPMNARKNIGINNLKSEICSRQYAKTNFLTHNDARPGNGNETLSRYRKIAKILSDSVQKPDMKYSGITQKLDDIFMHKIWGFVIFIALLFIIFQSVFSFSKIPMDAIEAGFIYLGNYLSEILPDGIVKDLFIGGILSGISGISIFIPQIALLFFFIAILEDTGYMARVSFIMDRVMRGFGLNGKSVIPLISGVACAVPAIMSSRTIANKKERLITILITPLMTCSARIPVYILLISLIIPEKKIGGILNLQGLILMGLYLIGFFTAVGAAFIMQYIINSKERSFFIMEMPTYKSPRWSNIALTMLEKVKVFVFDAGKIIVAISIILWALASFSPYPAPPLPNGQTQQVYAPALENSYAGIFGKKIEPFIAPLGFDWKIGIALITSFAAREVFVGTMATLYGVSDSAGNQQTIREKMLAEKNPETGVKIYSFATCISLLLFYAFAMQCMSTLAAVFRETKHWKWPIIQLIYMSGLAYISALLAYQWLK